MIEYPSCSCIDTCWYKGNTDRLNEYGGNSIEYVVSREKGRISCYDICEDYRPESFTLCDVCVDNNDLGINVGCTQCGKKMYDSWIIIDKAHYCRYCITNDEIFVYIEDEKKDEKNPLINMEEEEIAAFTRDHENGDIIDIIRDVIKYQKKKDLEALEKKKRKRVKYNDRLKCKIMKFLPEISSKTCTKIIEKHESIYYACSSGEEEEEEFRDMDSFVSWLIK
jgi:hypothetical protein